MPASKFPGWSDPAGHSHKPPCSCICTCCRLREGKGWRKNTHPLKSEPKEYQEITEEQAGGHCCMCISPKTCLILLKRWETLPTVTNPSHLRQCTPCHQNATTAGFVNPLSVLFWLKICNLCCQCQFDYLANITVSSSSLLCFEESPAHGMGDVCKAIQGSVMVDILL